MTLASDADRRHRRRRLVWRVSQTALQGERPPDLGVTPPGAVSLPWLLGWRWWAVGGQLAIVGTAHLALGVALPLEQVLPLIGLTAATNAGLAWGLGGSAELPRAAAGTILSLDTIVLTALLAVTGGPSNPFSIFYLVHIALAAVVLGAGWTWSLTALAVGCYGALFLAPDAGAGMHHHEAGFGLHLQGMWIAFTVAAVLTAYFVVSLADAVARRDAEIAAIREQAERAERLASLTTLAAGAAHSLGSPLATIAVAAKELERAVATLPERAAAAITGDAQLIRAEVTRCRRILDQMVADAGETTGEAPVPARAADLVADVLGELTPAERARVAVAPAAAEVTLAVPRRALAHATVSLLRNALAATAPSGTVSLATEAHGGGLRLVVRDGGPGMRPEVLARAVEPFFTTKPPGSGLGLGLFLARTLAEGLGGRLSLESTPGVGTRAAIELPGGPR